MGDWLERSHLNEDCGTVLVFKNEFVFAAIEVEDGCLLALEHKVVVVDKFVFGEAGDEVGLAYSLRALGESGLTTIM